MNAGKIAGLAIAALVAIMIVRAVGIPSIGGMPTLPMNDLKWWLLMAIPFTFIIAGIVMMHKKIGGGIILLALGLAILLFNPANIAEVGNNAGTALAEASRGLNENGPLPTTGKIELERTFGNPKVFALANTYRRLDVPPGTELCADPIHFVDQGRQSTPAVRYVRSNIEGTVVNIHFYFMPYGESCDLLPSSPDPRARTEENSNIHLTHA